jgi:hypothetical protein
MDAMRMTAQMRRIPLLVGGMMTDASGVYDVLAFIGGNGDVDGYYAKRGSFRSANFFRCNRSLIR